MLSSKQDCVRALDLGCCHTYRSSRPRRRHSCVGHVMWCPVLEHAAANSILLRMVFCSIAMPAAAAAGV